MKSFGTLTSPVICPTCGRSTYEIVEYTRVSGCIIESAFSCRGCEDRAVKVDYE